MAQICRTCLQEITSPNFVEITRDDSSSQVKIEMLLCIPEVDLNLLGNPGICSSCLMALNASYVFKKKCLYTEERIRSYISKNKQNTDIKIQDVYNSYSLAVQTDTSFAPNRTYIDDLNDLLDDALGGKDELECDTTITIKEEVIDINDDIVLIGDTTVSETHRPVINTPENDPLKTPATEFLKKAHTNNAIKQRKCKVCAFTTNNLEELKLHRKVHGTTKALVNNSPNKLFKCKGCPFTTTYRASLNRHSKVHVKTKVGNPLENLWKCKVCSFQSTNLSLIKLHLKQHVKKSAKARIKCKQCTFTAFDLPTLKLHETKEHANPLKPVKCNVCSFMTTDSSLMQVHRLDHRKTKAVTNTKPPKKKVLKCKECLFTTVNGATLKTHMKEHKAKVMINQLAQNLFKCNVCQFSSTELTLLNIHKKTHQRTRVSCTMCNFSTIVSSVLEQHYEDHKIFLLLTCSKCNFKTLKPRVLENHKIKIHQNVAASEGAQVSTNVYKCIKCTYGCELASDMKKHLLEEHGMAMYLCIICKTLLVNAVAFQNHLVQHEDSAEKYKCQFCEYTSNNQISLTGHMRVHVSNK